MNELIVFLLAIAAAIAIPFACLPMERRRKTALLLVGFLVIFAINELVSYVLFYFILDNSGELEKIVNESFSFLFGMLILKLVPIVVIYLSFVVSITYLFLDNIKRLKDHAKFQLICFSILYLFCTYIEWFIIFELSSPKGKFAIQSSICLLVLLVLLLVPQKSGIMEWFDYKYY